MSAVKLAEVYSKSSKDSQKSPEYKRFIWDVVFRYFALLGVTLVVIGLGQEFFLERGLGCNTPAYVNRDQYTFVVLWCSREVRRVDLLPLLILLQTASILAPQILWEVYADPSLRQFFRLIPRMDRLRNKASGNYDVDTSRTVAHLTKKYGQKGNSKLLLSYVIKLMSQNILCVFFLFLMAGLYQGRKEFQVDFVCSQVGHLDGFNLSTIQGLDPLNVSCTYTISEAFFPLWIADLILLIITASFGIFGLVWIIRISHREELDNKGKADFYYSFAMNGGKYDLDDPHKIKFRVKSDLDFLILLLFNSDRGQGETFYEVQVELRLQSRWADDHDEHSKYVSKIGRTVKDHPQKIPQMLDELLPTHRSAESAQCHLGEYLIKLCTAGVNHWTLYNNTLHLFCGSRGCTLSLGKLSETIYAVDFNPFFVPPSPLKEDVFTNIVHLRVPADITSKTGPESAELTRRLRKENEKEIQFDLVVITCMEPQFRSSTVKVILSAVLPKQEISAERENETDEQAKVPEEHDGNARKTDNGCFIVVCSRERSHIKEIMEDLGVFCGPVVLDQTVCPCQTNGVYQHSFRTAGGTLSIYFQVIKFNREMNETASVPRPALEHDSEREREAEAEDKLEGTVV